MTETDRLWAMKTKLEELVCRAGDALPLGRDASQLQIQEKSGPANYVTVFDKATQQFLAEGCHALAPEALFIGEEEDAGGDGGNADTLPCCFVVDPIDGTANFIRGWRHSAVSLAYLEQGQAVIAVVYDPALRECFTAVKGAGAYVNGQQLQVSDTPCKDAVVGFGSSPYYPALRQQSIQILDKLLPQIGDVRRAGSAALDLAWLAAGRMDGFFELRLSPWDWAAGSLLVTEAGGMISDPVGAPLGYAVPKGVVAGNDQLYRLLLSCLR